MKNKGQLVHSQNGEIFDIDGEEWIFVGRCVDPEKGNLRIEKPAISKLHAALCGKNEFVIEDRSSKNGTFVNGVQLKNKERRVLMDGDLILFATEQYRFNYQRGEGAKFRCFGMDCQYLHTENGKKICFHIERSPVVEYQLRMINANPELCIPECMYIRKLEQNSLFFEVTNRETLETIIEKGELCWEGFLELLKEIMIIVQMGEAHMLFKEQYAISEDLIFFMPLHRQNENQSSPYMKIIYFPIMLNQTYDFKTMLLSFVQRIMPRLPSISDDADVLLKQLEESGEATDDLLKTIISFKQDTRGVVAVLPEIPTPPASQKWHNMFFPLFAFLRVWMLPFLSYGLFMAAFWSGILDIVELIGLGTVLLGFCFFTLKKKGRKEDRESMEGEKEAIWTKWM